MIWLYTSVHNLTYDSYTLMYMCFTDDLHMFSSPLPTQEGTGCWVMTTDRIMLTFSVTFDTGFYSFLQKLFGCNFFNKSPPRLILHVLSMSCALNLKSYLVWKDSWPVLLLKLLFVLFLVFLCFKILNKNEGGKKYFISQDVDLLCVD